MIKDIIGASSTDLPGRKVIETLGDFIKATDVDKHTGLTNFCYVNDPKIDSEEFQKNKMLIGRCRGVVFDGENVVMRAFLHTDEFSESEVLSHVIDKFSEIGNGDVKKGIGMCRFYESHEGALIRMFNFKGKWFTTTHRKLNAFTSKWGSSESYGATFKAALRHQTSVNNVLLDKIQSLPTNSDMNLYDSFQATLDVDKQYMFLVRNTEENRLVSSAPIDPTMYHVGTFVNGELDMDIDISVFKPVSFEFNTVEEIQDHVRRVNPADTPGLIVFCPGNIQFKISNNEYIRMFNIRGNQPSIKFRYLQVRMNRMDNEMIRTMYPNSIHEFNEYERILNDVSKKIHNSYMNRFIHKQYVSVPVGEYQVMRIAHGWFLEDRDNRRVTFNVINGIVNEQKATSLNQMIKKHNHDIFTAEKERKREDEDEDEDEDGYDTDHRKELRKMDESDYKWFSKKRGNGSDLN